MARVQVAVLERLINRRRVSIDLTGLLNSSAVFFRSVAFTNAPEFNFLQKAGGSSGSPAAAIEDDNAAADDCDAPDQNPDDEVRSLWLYHYVYT
jgi:hypothetical protein